MRLEQTERVIRLILDLQGTRTGLTIEDIQNRFSVSRRTAERMKATVESLFPILEQINPDEVPKRWRIPGERLRPPLNLTKDELSALRTAIKTLDQENLSAHKNSLEGLAAKLDAVIDYQSRVRLETDIEALAEAEGFAMRPGPRLKVDETILSDLRRAILANERICITYKSASTGKTSYQKVCPYGFIFGHRHYLVAWSRNQAARDYRLFILGNIERVEFLGEYFERDGTFDLAEYASRSFGVFQEQPFDVVWKFSKEAAEEAKSYLFHPRQKMEDGDDGTLLVSFRAGGWLEMCWHLFQWGKDVEIVEPEWLKEKFKQLKEL